MDGTADRVRTEVALSSFVLKRVCAACNNGWMSRLEERAKPILIGVWNGSLAAESLSRTDRNTLASWTAKTAIIETYAVGAENPPPASLLQWMRTHEEDAPGRFGVALATTKLAMVGHLQVGMIHDLIGSGTSSASIVVLAFPNLVLTCAFPVPEFTMLSYRLRCDFLRTSHYGQTPRPGLR